jgi:hypothetical protein
VTTYRLMDGVSGRPGVGSSGTTPPTSPTSYSGPFQAGTVFFVTAGGMWLEGYWWWCPTGGDTGAQKFCLWQLTATGSIAGTLVPNSSATSGTLTAGAWNYVPLATPIQLSIGYAGTMYIAATGWTSVHGFPDTHDQFATGDPYAGGITSGPLQCWGDPTGGGTTHGIADFAQGIFGTGNTGGAADPSLNMPNAGSNSSNFWIDVSVSDTAPMGYSGSYRIWPNKFDVATTSTGIDLNAAYILGTEFTLSQNCTLNNLWFYSPATVTQLPTQCAIWNVNTQAIVAGTLQTSPSWSGAAGAGWVYVPYSGVTLAAGDYKASVWNAAASGSGTGWNNYAIDYFTTLDGAAGITTGPVSVPDAAAAASPGQSTYETSSSTFLYPDQYVAAEGQSYWVDAEVTIVPPPPPPPVLYSMRMMP